MIDPTAVQAWFGDFVDTAVIMQTDKTKRLAYNYDHLKTGLQTKVPCIHPTIILEDPAGRPLWNGALHDQTNFGFWVMKKMAKQDYEQENAIVLECDVVARKIIAKMLYEYENDLDTVMRFLNPANINYEKAGPAIDNLFGVYYSYSLELGDGYEYDALDYVE